MLFVTGWQIVRTIPQHEVMITGQTYINKAHTTMTEWDAKEPRTTPEVEKTVHLNFHKC